MSVLMSVLGKVETRNFSRHPNCTFHARPEKDWDIRIHVQDGFEGFAET